MVDRPFFVYQDFSYDLLRTLIEDQGVDIRQFFRTLDDRTLARRTDRQHEIYAKAAGVIAMSKWFASSLVRDSGLPPSKVFVAHPGATSVSQRPAGSSLRPRPRPRHRLLFLGTSFLIKGGDLVVRALEFARKEDPEIRLTVAGPRAWPLPGTPPPGVDFIGPVPRSRVADLLDRHDLLVMPSRLEGFGIVFAEALARGVPCIGRNAFAMPEIIEDGVTGALVISDDPAALSDTILQTLSDDSIFAEVALRSGDPERQLSWHSTAQTIFELMRGADT